MTGKASLLVVMGFSLIFLIVGQNFGVVSNRAVEDYVEYNVETIAHNIAVSGANVAANGLFRNSNWAPSGYPKDFQGGTLDIDVVDNGTNRNVIVTGSYGVGSDKIESQVLFTLTRSNFAEYAYYSEFERSSPTGGDIWWIKGDVVNGPFHTQDDLRVSEKPSFLGKKTSHKGNLVYKTNKTTDAPKITGQYMPGLDIPMPVNAVEDLEPWADDDGYKFDSHDTVYIYFDRDSIRYKYSYSAKYTAAYLPDFAPNGMIYAKDAVVRLKGTVKGQYTVGCVSSTASTGEGTIWLDDDIVYDKNPKIYPTSTDMLGIIAENYVKVTDNKANTTLKDINIHASIFCENYGFGADKYDTRSKSGTIKLLGGIQQSYRQAVGTFDGSGIKTGFLKYYDYDTRLGSMWPPYYPNTGKFKIVSWLE